MSKKESISVNVNISNHTVIRILILTIVSLIIFAFFSKIAGALQLIFVSAFLAIALNPAVSWFTKKIPSKSRIRGTAAAYFMVIIILIGFFALVVPPFVSQAVDLFDEIPTNVQDLENQDTAIVRFIDRYNLKDVYTDIVSQVKENISAITSQAVSTAGTVGSGIIALLTVFVMTFMMLVEGPRWTQRWVEMQPERKVEKRIKVLKDMYTMVTGYVNGQLLIAAIAATFAFFALVISSTILGVTINPIALAVIVGLIGLIPMIGNTIAAIVVVIFCLFVSLPLAIIMAAFFLIYQQIENATLQPMIQAKYNDLTPLVVFISAIIGVSVAGFLGALVAIPIAGCLRIYIKAYFADKIAPKNKEKIAT
ncbi:AI-2E family transporter [Candidatus Saccharibacteria bacterium]|nr:AI-2E family transporter [Candidatus Saccharibacteria bacterium]